MLAYWWLQRSDSEIPKILNCLKADINTILKSDIIMDLIKALTISLPNKSDYNGVFRIYDNDGNELKVLSYKFIVV